MLHVKGNLKVPLYIKLPFISFINTKVLIVIEIHSDQTTTTFPFDSVNIMAADVLATPGARASVGMVLT